MNELTERIDQVPSGDLWVHCASGFRAGIATSILDRAGRTVTLIDDDCDHAADTKMHLTTA